MVSFHDVAVPVLHETLSKVVRDKKYRHQAQLVSEQFRDNLVDPMEESMYWIEFIGRHKMNYPIFKSHAPHVPWYEYFYLDILVATVIAVLASAALAMFSLKMLWRKYVVQQITKQKVN